MYLNLDLQNLKPTDDLEIEGEVMLLHTLDYAPQALSAVAKLKKLAGKFVCHFEVISNSEFFVTEVDAADAFSCFHLAEKKMRRKMACAH